MDYFARCSSGNKDIDKELAQKFIESMHISVNRSVNIRYRWIKINYERCSFNEKRN